MEKMVQQNASLVEAAAATESMKGQAAALLELVSAFDPGHLAPTAAAHGQLHTAEPALSLPVG